MNNYKVMGLDSQNTGCHASCVTADFSKKKKKKCCKAFKKKNKFCKKCPKIIFKGKILKAND